MREVNETVSPDSLMRSFRGRNIVGILMLAVIVHVVVIFGSSSSYLRKEVFGKDTSKMEKDDRVKVALGEATTALGEIAKRHNLSVDDITAKFAAAGSRASQLTEPKKPDAPDAASGKNGTAPKPADATSRASSKDSPSPSAIRRIHSSARKAEWPSFMWQTEG